MNKDKIINIASFITAAFIVVLIAYAGSVRSDQDDWSKLQAKKLPELEKWCFTWNKNWFDDISAPHCKVGGIYYYETRNTKARNIVLEKINAETK